MPSSRENRYGPNSNEHCRIDLVTVNVRVRVERLGDDENIAFRNAVGDSYASCAANKRFVPFEEKKKEKKRTKEREKSSKPTRRAAWRDGTSTVDGDEAGVCNFNNKFWIKRYIYYVSCPSNLFLATACHP